jgi:predicted nucleic acid-binding protein
VFWTYFAGVALIAGGIGMMAPMTMRLAGMLAGIVILLWVVLLHIPRAMSAPHESNSSVSGSNFQIEPGSGLTCMSAPDFLDANILVYAYDAGHPEKQRIAQDLFRKAVAGESVISTQVLAEFAATLLHKLAPAAHPDDVIALLEALNPIRVIAPNEYTVRRAVEAQIQIWSAFLRGYDSGLGRASELRKDWVRGLQCRTAVLWHSSEQSLSSSSYLINCVRSRELLRMASQ